MIKWVAFAVVSVGWIATCYFMGSMVGGTAAGVPASQAQDACARRLIAAAAAEGRTLEMMDARFSDECGAVHRQTLQELSAPAVRKGLLWGVLPVVFVGGLLVMRSRQ